MIRADFHFHTSFSSDSETALPEQLNAMIARGMDEVCVTDHDDPGYPDHEFILDLSSYYSTTRRISGEYNGKLTVHTGIELGLWTAQADTIRAHASAYPWDFVIGSTHLIDGQDPYYEEYWDGKNIDACVRRYYEATLENILAFDCFDVYGHLDYIIRYIPEDRKSEYHPELCQDLIEEILKTLISRNKGIECNTAGFKYGLGHPNPCEDLLSRYHALGGRILTIGSDGHKPEHVAYDFEKVPDLLKSCGFDHYTVFRGRKPYFIPIDR